MTAPQLGTVVAAVLSVSGMAFDLQGNHVTMKINFLG